MQSTRQHQSGRHVVHNLLPNAEAHNSEMCCKAGSRAEPATPAGTPQLCRSSCSRLAGAFSARLMNASLCSQALDNQGCCYELRPRGLTVGHNAGYSLVWATRWEAMPLPEEAAIRSHLGRSRNTQGIPRGNRCAGLASKTSHQIRKGLSAYCQGRKRAASRWVIGLFASRCVQFVARTHTIYCIYWV